jgi:radical SAM protein with 4Fe4S-binding SPASM domain
MIDQEKLQKAYDEDRIYALQLEIGDVCDQGCIYCYMNAIPEPVNQLSDLSIAAILEDAVRLDIAAIEWLGGEPLLRRSIFKHMARARELGLRNNMWTGGLPLADRKILTQTAKLTCHGLIAIHLSTVSRDVYRLLHPDRPAEDMEIILDAIRRLLDTGYPADQVLNSVTFTGLQTSDDMIATIDYFEERFGIKTCVNVYHTYLRPGLKDVGFQRFIPSISEVARVYKRYGRQYGLKHFPMNCVNKQYCSATMAVLCDGSVTPCATIREAGAPKVFLDGGLYDIFNKYRDKLIFSRLKKVENLPQECRRCKISEDCWGCRSRSFAAGLGLEGRDPRCFRSKEIR